MESSVKTREYLLTSGVRRRESHFRFEDGKRKLLVTHSLLHLHLQLVNWVFSFFFPKSEGRRWVLTAPFLSFRLLPDDETMIMIGDWHLWWDGERWKEVLFCFCLRVMCVFPDKRWTEFSSCRQTSSSVLPLYSPHDDYIWWKNNVSRVSLFSASGWLPTWVYLHTWIAMRVLLSGDVSAKDKREKLVVRESRCPFIIAVLSIPLLNNHWGKQERAETRLTFSSSCQSISLI